MTKEMIFAAVGGAVFVFGIGLMADGGRNVAAEKKTLLVFLRRF
jgi:hypothetical protein